MTHLLKPLLFAFLTGEAVAQSIYFNPANAVGAGHESLIEYSAWAWSERTGMDATYAGTTSAGECEPNAITIRTPILLEWQLAGQAAGFDTGPNGPHAWTFTCPYGGFTILLSPYQPVSRVMILHDLGHTLKGFDGIPHLTFTQGALMLSSPPVEALITREDTAYVLATPDWPVPYSASHCFVEVANDLDLMIPNVSGRRLLLNYAGIQNGYNTWTVVYNYATLDTACSGNTVSGTTATLHDIRGLNQSYSAAVFEAAGPSTYRLMSLTP